MDVSAILDPLNDAQREGVCAPLQNALILAGAGSGVLLGRLVFLSVDRGQLVMADWMLGLAANLLAAALQRIETHQRHVRRIDQLTSVLNAAAEWQRTVDEGFQILIGSSISTETYEIVKQHLADFRNEN